MNGNIPLERYPKLVARLQGIRTDRTGKLSDGQIELAVHAAALDEESREQATGETDAGWDLVLSRLEQPPAGKPDMMKPPEPVEPDTGDGPDIGHSDAGVQGLWDKVIERHR